MSDATLKLISLNVEGDKHWDLIVPFLERESPDVLCVQEIYEDELGTVPFAHHVFLPNTRRPHTAGGAPARFGMATFSNHPFTATQSAYYDANTDELPVFDRSAEDTIHKTYWHGYIRVDVALGETFRIINTHFTWTPHGEAEPYQADDLKDMLRALETEGEHALCGDFNIPRGKNPLAAVLVEHYTDQIPAHYSGSMDMARHRAKDTPDEAHVATNMVDYLLTTPRFTAQDVRLQGGVSDHMAIVATLRIR